MAGITFSTGTLSRRSQAVILIAIVALFLAAVWFTYNAVHITNQNGNRALDSVSAMGNSPINNFNECAAANNPVQQTYPETCTADGTTFVQTQ